MALSIPDTPLQKFQPPGLQKVAIAGLIFVVTMLLSSWWMHKNIYAAPFTPTQLTISEQHVLETKMAQLTGERNRMHSSDKTTPTASALGPLDPEPYQEDATKREIRLTEKELNALIAKDPETAKYVAVDLANDLVSVKLLVPMAQDFPVLGGKTLRLHLGVVLKYANNKPVIAIRGMSLGGIPLPQSWWGDMKNVNLVQKFGAEGGFWDQFAKGVEDLSIQEGQLRVKLKE